MKIVIPDDYQDMVDRLECFALIRGHDVVRYRAPAKFDDVITIDEMKKWLDGKGLKSS